MDMHKKIDETNLSKPSLLLSNRNRVRRPALRAPPPAKWANTVLGTRRRANAARPCPRRRGRVPALRGSRGRSSSRRAGEEPCRSSRAARSSCSLVGPAAAISGHGGSISGGHQGSYVRLIHSPIYATSFRCSVLLIASVLQFTAKLRTTSDCCCFMPLVTTEPEEQILKSSNHNQ